MQLAAESNKYAAQFASWRQNTRHSDLVTNIYVFKAGKPQESVFARWNDGAGQFEVTPYLGQLRSLPPYLRAGSIASVSRKELRGPPAVWALDGRKPGVVYLITASLPSRGKAYLIIELNPDVLQKAVLPEILSWHVKRGAEAEYRLALLSARHPGTPLYRSESGLSSKSFAAGDEKLALFEPCTGLPRVSDMPFSSPEGPDCWELAGSRRKGSLAAVEERMRLIYLGVNFGILLALASAVGAIVVYTLKAHNLLRHQMEFVANVSHDLRTPLSVIGSAADNLAEGVVRSDHSVREYGSLIRSECRRLSDMVEKTLRFAAGKADYRTRNVQFLKVGDVIEDILRDEAAIIDASGFDIEKRIDPGLPMVRVDSRALSECLLNFISNALKYGGEERWLGIHARPVETGRGTGVQITVQDRGPGIPVDELPYIFEPFYRGRNARAAQAGGTGLGLSLAQEAANSMGARITVESAPGQGSAFTVHVPAAYMNSSTVPVEALVES